MLKRNYYRIINLFLYPFHFTISRQQINYFNAPVVWTCETEMVFGPHVNKLKGLFNVSETIRETIQQTARVRFVELKK